MPNSGIFSTCSAPHDKIYFCWHPSLAGWRPVAPSHTAQHRCDAAASTHLPAL